MAKYTLENNFEFDFVLFSIVCHESEYRLCSSLKKNLGLDFERDKSLELKNKKQKDILNFSMFSFYDEPNLLDFFLLNNLSSNAAKIEEKSISTAQAGLFDEVEEDANFKKGRLVPELDEADYFLLIKGDISEREKNNLLRQLNALEVIRSCKEINPDKLNSKNNLLF